MAPAIHRRARTSAGQAPPVPTSPANAAPQTESIDSEELGCGDLVTAPPGRLAAVPATPCGSGTLNGRYSSRVVKTSRRVLLVAHTRLSWSYVHQHAELLGADPRIQLTVTRAPDAYGSGVEADIR